MCNGRKEQRLSTSSLVRATAGRPSAGPGGICPSASSSLLPISGPVLPSNSEGVTWVWGIRLLGHAGHETGIRDEASDPAFPKPPAPRSPASLLSSVRPRYQVPLSILRPYPRRSATPQAPPPPVRFPHPPQTPPRRSAPPPQALPTPAPLLKPPGWLRHIPQGPRSGRRSAPRRRAARQRPPSWAQTPPVPASAPRPPGAARPTSSRRRRRRSFYCWAPPSWDQVRWAGATDGARRGTSGASAGGPVSVDTTT